MLAGVIGRDERRKSRAQRVDAAVFEGEIARTDKQAVGPESAEVVIEGDTAEGDDDADGFEQGQFAAQETAALANLLGCGFVIRWSTAGGGGNPGVAQFESVVAPVAFGL